MLYPIVASHFPLLSYDDTPVWFCWLYPLITVHIVTSQSFLGHESWSIHIWRFQKINGRYLQIIHVNFVLSIKNHPSLGTPWLWKPTCIYIYGTIAIAIYRLRYMIPLLYIYHIPYHIYSIHNIYIIYITYIYIVDYIEYTWYNIYIYNIEYT